MHENPTPETASEQHERLQRDALYLLTGEDGAQPVWSVSDIARELEGGEDAEIAVDGLIRSGLAYKTREDFVFASRAGVRMVAMVGHVI
jgi:hypothetical protein